MASSAGNSIDYVLAVHLKAYPHAQRHADGQRQRACETHFDARQKNTAISAVTPRLAV
jgi:hypothetical protein